MFQRILLPADNSRYSDLSLEMALAVAERFGSNIVGFHAYAARLHENRFRQLEPSLPQKYQERAALDKQRQVHGSLILKGLEIISRAYLEGCAARCQERGVAFQQRVAEGKNYAISSHWTPSVSIDGPTAMPSTSLRRKTGVT